MSYNEREDHLDKLAEELDRKAEQVKKQELEKLQESEASSAVNTGQPSNSGNADLSSSIRPPRETVILDRKERRAAKKLKKQQKKSQKSDTKLKFQKKPSQQQEKKEELVQKAQTPRNRPITPPKASPQPSVPTVPKPSLLSHLEETPKDVTVPINNEEIHPAIIRLGMQYANETIRGGNARCVALLTTFKEVIKDYQCPEDKVINIHLDQKLKPMIDYITKCRPMSTSMRNAIKHIKFKIHHLDPKLKEEEAKASIIEEIDTFINERIIFTMKQIVQYGVDRIKDGDCILTYARSEVVEKILFAAHDKGIKFIAVVVDSAPKYEGKVLLSKLSAMGIKCSYTLLHAVSHMMQKVTKVFLGAHSMLLNGMLVGRSGTASIAMVARNFNVPVLVCCETYKFIGNAQLDSVTRNELGNPDEIISNSKNEQLKNWKQLPNLSLLNLVYDVTPPKFISVVITEVGLVPPTSVAVILREYNQKMKL